MGLLLPSVQSHYMLVIYRKELVSHFSQCIGISPNNYTQISGVRTLEAHVAPAADFFDEMIDNYISK